ncbi:MAG: helix-turn-helix transcriptional regulator [Flavobacteriaceae bacterium]|jgi:transcriptional regulator with XRE-family HTH domain|nr:helix-turn-helix transcriptional regulator [Flavobacteriaceae bacterium]
MKLSEKLFMTRSQLKLSKKEVADRLNMDVTTYGRVESGQRSLEIEKLKLLPQALGIDAKEILELLEFDKGNTFHNIIGDYSSNGNCVQTTYAENKESLAEIKRLYDELLKHKDEMIHQLKDEVKNLKK